MNKDTIAVLGVPIDNLNIDETIDLIFEMIEAYRVDKRPRLVATVNVDFIVNTLAWKFGAIRHPELLDILRRADIVTADGMPIVWISKLLGAPLKERVTGADIVPGLAEEAAERQKSIYLLGGEEKITKQAADAMVHSYPGLKIAGIDSPYVHIEGEEIRHMEDNDLQIVERINRSGADILLIFFGNPKQEVWFERNRERLKVPVSIGVGGTYEFLAGAVARAPEWMQDAGLEWLYRIPRSPSKLLKRLFYGIFKLGPMICPAILHFQCRRLLYNERNRFYCNNDISQYILNTDAMRSINNYTKVITLPDRLDVTTIDQLRCNAEDIVAANSKIVLDFNRVLFVDTFGLGFLIKLCYLARKKGKGIYLIGVKPQISKVCKLNRTWDLFKDIIFENAEEVMSLTNDNEHLPYFYYSIESVSGFNLLKLYGRLDAAEMAKLDIESLVKDIEGMDCIMNLENLSFVDSSGLVFFLKIQRHLSRHGKTCGLRGLTVNVRQMFNTTRLNHLFKMDADMSPVLGYYIDKILEGVR